MGGEADEGMRAMEAALSNPLVAEGILNQAEFDDKKNIRLLNKFWRDSTLDLWRKSVALKIRCAKRLRYIGYKWKNLLHVDTFQMMMKGKSDLSLFRIQDKPFGSLALYQSDLWLPIEGKGQPKELNLDLSRFLEKFGSRVIRMEGLEIPCETGLNGLSWLLQRACPRLKALAVYIDLDDLSNERKTGFGEGLQVQQMKSLLTNLDIKLNWKRSENADLVAIAEVQPYPVWSRILNLMPNLKVLKHRGKVETRKRDKGIPIVPVTATLGLYLSNGKYFNLNVLDLKLSLHSDEGDLRFLELNNYLQVAQPPPSEIIINAEFNYGHALPILPYFHEFCSLHGNLLTQLVLTITKPNFDDRTDWISVLNGYYFPNLTHLFIDEIDEPFIEDGDAYTFVPFDFESFRGMPKLEVFHMFDQHGNIPLLRDDRKLFSLNWETYRGNGHNYPETNAAYLQYISLNPIVMNELKEFKFYTSYAHFDEQSLSIVLGWMRGLKTLEIFVDVETLPVVYAMLPNLESLTLHGYSYKDFFIRQEMKTGILEPYQYTLKILEAEQKLSPRTLWNKFWRRKTERIERQWIQRQWRFCKEAWSFVSYRKNSDEATFLCRDFPEENILRLLQIEIFRILWWNRKTRIFVDIGSRVVEFKL